MQSKATQQKRYIRRSNFHTIGLEPSTTNTHWQEGSACFTLAQLAALTGTTWFGTRDVIVPDPSCAARTHVR